MAISRRELIGGSSTVVLLDGAAGNVWSGAARAALHNAPLRVLGFNEAAWLAAVGAAIAPPSRSAGLVHYVDHHLSLPASDCLLALRYLDVAPPYAEFYRAGLAAMPIAAQSPTPPPDGDPSWSDILARLAAGGVAGWVGPPSPLLLFAIRLDSIDIAWGTRTGFERLGVPYLAHVEPETDW